MKKFFSIVLLIVTTLINLSPYQVSRASADNVKAQHGDVAANQVETSLDPINDFSPSMLSTNSFSVIEEWRYTLWPDKITVRGVLDIDNDGFIEIVASGYLGEGNYDPVCWIVMREVSPNKYERIWISEPYPYTAKIVSIAVDDVNGDGIAEIYVFLEDANTYVYRGTDFANIALYRSRVPQRPVVITDLDGNGSKELISSNDYSLTVYNPLNFEMLWQLSDYAKYSSLAVGNVDNDPALEIVSSDGNVLDGATHQIEWTYPSTGGFGWYTDLGDVDHDGIAEIIGAISGNKITVFDADLKSQAWEYITPIQLTDLAVADINGDAYADIVYGDSSFGKIHCIDGKTHTEIWNIDNPGSGVNFIEVANTDQDEELEIIWGAGYTNSSRNYLIIAGSISHKIDWQSEDLEGPVNVVDTGDVDDDGDLEILMATYASNSGSDDSVIICFDSISHAEEWRIDDIPNTRTVYGIRSIKIGDVDDDGETEFVITSRGDNFIGVLQIFDGKTHMLERQSPQGYSNTPFTTMDFGDMDGDGHTEIVVGVERAHTGPASLSIIIFDGATALEEWRSSPLGSDDFLTVYDLLLTDIDDDAHVEIIVAFSGYLYVFDGVDHTMESQIPIGAESLAVGDLDNDGEQSILVGLWDSTINVYNGKSRQLEKKITPAVENQTQRGIACLTYTDLDRDEIPELLVCTDSRLAAYSQTGTLLWQSGVLGSTIGSTVGKFNQVSVRNMDVDYDMEIVVGGSSMLYQFEAQWVGPFRLSSMAVSPNVALPGNQVTYTIVVKNEGIEDFADVQVSNALPRGLIYVADSLTASSGSASYANGVITWNGPMNNPSAVTITYQVSLGEHINRAPLQNVAQITAASYSQFVSALLKIPPITTFLPSNRYLNFCGDFFDDFTERDRNWSVSNDAYMRTDYTANDEYRFVGKKPGYIYLVAAPTCKHAQYIVEVDAYWGQNKGDGLGLLFGINDNFSQYNIFTINTDKQTYDYISRDEYGWQGVNPKQSTAIKTDKSVNHIKVSWKYTGIEIEINGTKVVAFEYGSFSPAYVGFFNMPYSNVAYADAIFDNFRLTVVPSPRSPSMETGESFQGTADSFSDNPLTQPFLVAPITPEDFEQR